MSHRKGWHRDSYEHGLASRGIRSRGMIRAYKPLIHRRFKELRTHNQRDLIKFYDYAYLTLEGNDWSKDKALKALDRDYDRYKRDFKQGKMKKEIFKEATEANENVQSLIGFVPIKTMKEWPTYRKKHVAKYGEP